MIARDLFLKNNLWFMVVRMSIKESPANSITVTPVNTRGASKPKPINSSSGKFWTPDLLYTLSRIMNYSEVH